MALLAFALSHLPSLTTLGWIIMVMIFLMLLYVSLICSCGYADLRINELEKAMTVITETLAKSVENQKLEREIFQLLQSKVDTLSSHYESNASNHPHLAQFPVAPLEKPAETEVCQQLLADVRELLAPVRRLTIQHKQFVEHMVQIQQLRGTLKELVRQVVDLRIRLETQTDGNEQVEEGEPCRTAGQYLPERSKLFVNAPSPGSWTKNDEQASPCRCSL